MKDSRGVLLVATGRGLEPIDRQRFPTGFKAKWTCSIELGGGLVHAFSPVVTVIRLHDGTTVDKKGWATFCTPTLVHNHLTSYTKVPRETTPVTCIACLNGLTK